MAVIIGDGMPEVNWIRTQNPRNRLANGGGRGLPDLADTHQPAGAVAQYPYGRYTLAGDHRILFPIARALPLRHYGRAGGNGDAVRDVALPLLTVVAPPSAFLVMADQVPNKLPALGINILVNRLMVDPDIRMVKWQAARDLPGR